MDGKVLGDLKVAELRVELEKRDLDKNGVKQVLIERLKEALISEGKDPSVYTFSAMETVLPSAEVSLVDTEKSGSNENPSSELVPEHTKAEEVATEECSIPKKATSDSDPYVVHIEEPEEDLDYDLKSESVVSKEAETCTDQGKVEKDVLKDSDSAMQQVKDLSNLRVSNLSKSTKAADLKQHFSAHGKVLSAKILASTRSRGCFGFLTMASSEDAASCILNLDGTEFNGTVIKVEVTDKEPVSSKALIQSAKDPISVKDVRKRAVRRRFRGAPYIRALSRRAGVLLDSTRRYYRPAYATAHLTRTVNRASRYLSRSAVSTTSRGLEYLRRPVQSPRPRPATTPPRRPSLEGYPVRYSPNKSQPSPKVRIDYSVPRYSSAGRLPSPNRGRGKTPTRPVQRWPENNGSGHFRDYSPGARPSEDSRRAEVDTRRESSYFRRSSPVFSKPTSRTPPSQPPRREQAGPALQFRHSIPSSYHASRVNPDNYVCTDRRGRSSERDSTAPQMHYESSTRNSHPDYIYKTERPAYDSYAYPHAHQSSDMRRSEEQRGWRIPNQTNISGSRRSYVERSRSRSPVSPVRRHSQSRRDPSPASWNRGVDSSSDYITSTAAANRASYSSDMYGRKSNGSAADQDYNRGRNHAQSQRASSRSFSRVIDYGHRSGTSAQWQSQSSGNYYDTSSRTGGGQWRSGYYSRPHY